MHSKARKKSRAEFIRPELATLTKRRFSDKDWIFEKKFDGVRCIAVCQDKKINLYSRNKNLLNDYYPEIIEALAKINAHNFVLDGEVVARSRKGSKFSALQARMHTKATKSLKKQVPIEFCLFDLLYLDGYDLRKVPLIERKKFLREKIKCTKPVKYTMHKVGNGELYFKIAQKKGWEGIIAKKADSTYLSARTIHWLKMKCVENQELVICGFTKPQGSRVGFGALLMGYYSKGGLKYAGKVGTGYDFQLLKSLGARLKKIEQATSPFKTEDVCEKNVHWVRPTLVAQVGFTEWTHEGKLRHPAFLGIRKDKSARSVRRERAK